MSRDSMSPDYNPEKDPVFPRWFGHVMLGIAITALALIAGKSISETARKREAKARIEIEEAMFKKGIYVSKDSTFLKIAGNDPKTPIQQIRNWYLDFKENHASSIKTQIEYKNTNGNYSTTPEMKIDQMTAHLVATAPTRESR